MTLKPLLFSGMLLSGIIFAACQPANEAATSDSVLEESVPDTENDTILQEPSNGTMMDEQDAFLEEDTEPSTTPLDETTTDETLLEDAAQ